MVSNTPNFNTQHSRELDTQREEAIFSAYNAKFAPLNKRMTELAKKQMTLFGRQDKKSIELSDRWMDSINIFFTDIRNSNTHEGEYTNLDYLERQLAINLDAYTEAVDRLEKFTRVVESPATLSQRAAIREEITHAFNQIDNEKTMSNTLAVTYSLFAKLFAKYVPEEKSAWVQKVIQQTNTEIANMINQ